MCLTSDKALDFPEPQENRVDIRSSLRGRTLLKIDKVMEELINESFCNRVNCDKALNCFEAYIIKILMPRF